MNKKEIKLLNEMKENCLNGAKYIDSKAMEKYNLLRKIEDRLNNWNELKKWLKEEIEKNHYTHNINPPTKTIRVNRILNKMQEIESGVDE